MLFIGYALEESRQTTKSWWGTTLWSSWSRPWPRKATRHQAGKARERWRPWTGSWQRYDIWQFSCQVTKVSFYSMIWQKNFDKLYFAEIMTERYDIWQFSRQITKVRYYTLWFDEKIMLTSLFYWNYHWFDL